MTLFEIDQELTGLEQFLTQLGGEITDDEAFEAAIDAELARIKGNLADKLEGYCWLIKEFEARATARKAEAARLSQMAALDEKNVERLKSRLKVFFDAHQITKQETASFKIAIQKNGGAAPLTVPPEWESDPASAPEAYQRRVIQLDKFTIRAGIEAGEVIEGCAIGERGAHLRIR